MRGVGDVITTMYLYSAFDQIWWHGMAIVLSIYQSICPSNCSSIHRPSIHLSIFFNVIYYVIEIYVSACLYLSNYLSIYLSFVCFFLRRYIWLMKCTSTPDVTLESNRVTRPTTEVNPEEAFSSMRSCMFLANCCTICKNRLVQRKQPGYPDPTQSYCKDLCVPTDASSS